MSPVVLGIKKSEKRSEMSKSFESFDNSNNSDKNYQKQIHLNKVILDNDCHSPLNYNNSFIPDIYNPMNLASIICNKFKYNKTALARTFMQDLQMFEYLYEFLPKDIVVEVINNISLYNAIKIVKRMQCSTYIYDKINPLLYIIRYFSDMENTSIITKDPHCYEFDKSIIPKDSVLEFVLGCKEYISESNFQKLIKIVTSHNHIL